MELLFQLSYFNLFKNGMTIFFNFRVTGFYYNNLQNEIVKTRFLK